MRMLSSSLVNIFHVLYIMTSTRSYVNKPLDHISIFSRCKFLTCEGSLQVTKTILSTENKEKCLHSTRYPFIPHVAYITFVSVSSTGPTLIRIRLLLHHNFPQPTFLRCTFLWLSCNLLSKFLHSPSRKIIIMNYNNLRSLIVVLADVLVAVCPADPHTSSTSQTGQCRLLCCFCDLDQHLVKGCPDALRHLKKKPLYFFERSIEC